MTITLRTHKNVKYAGSYNCKFLYFSYRSSLFKVYENLELSIDLKLIGRIVMYRSATNVNMKTPYKSRVLRRIICIHSKVRLHFMDVSGILNESSELKTFISPTEV